MVGDTENHLNISGTGVCVSKFDRKDQYYLNWIDYSHSGLKVVHTGLIMEEARFFLPIHPRIQLLPTSHLHVIIKMDQYLISVRSIM